MLLILMTKNNPGVLAGVGNNDLLHSLAEPKKSFLRISEMFAIIEQNKSNSE